jgi:hydroxymethylpyrimidine/phosphomethylpyrimidine kinase
MTAVTAVTAQNTREVRSVQPLSPDIVRAQIESVVEDIGVDAAKTGMLHNARIIDTVAGALERYDIPVIVDPVMVSESGALLLTEDAVNALTERLLPRALLVTPNKHEAEVLSDIAINGSDDARRAARRIAALGPTAVLMKGGHIGTDATDLLYHEKQFTPFKGETVEGCLHGTGCTLAAAITAGVAKGQSLPQAIATAKEVVTAAIRYGRRIGSGPCPVNPAAWTDIPAERWEVYAALTDAAHSLQRMDIGTCVPEVGMNIAYALPVPYMQGADDVAAVDGRITRGRTGLRAGPVVFGASRHLARVAATVMRHDPSVRAVMNVRFDCDLVERARTLLTVSYYDRTCEPDAVKETEGSTMGWGIQQAIQRAGCVPDVIFHEGDTGKEPMILILGTNPGDVLEKFGMLLNDA